MLIEFTVENYRSFRDEAVLSMEATGSNQFRVYLEWHQILVFLFCYKRKGAFGVLVSCTKGTESTCFSREGQTFSFTEAKARRKLISQIVAENQLFFSVACTMNDADCAKAMAWFREMVQLPV